jgi:predicted ATP-grasp superfamily ATP-dependent carboligase
MTVQDRAHLRGIIESIKFPCIVKPAFSHDWKWDTQEQLEKFGPYKKALRKFDSKEELLDFCDSLPDRASGYIVQSYIDGRDESIVSFHGYFDEQSRCLGYFLGRKIRTFPHHTGGSAYIRTIHDEQLAKSSIEYFQRIGYQGKAKIDYKWDSESRQFLILEINPRYTLWELLGAYAGMNLAHIAYCHQRGEKIPNYSSYRDDARLLYFKQDFRAYVSGYRKTGEWSFLQYLRSLLAATWYRVFDPKDPAPFFWSFLDFLKRNLLRKGKRRGTSVMKGKAQEKIESALELIGANRLERDFET